MGDETYETLKRRVSDDLNAKRKEFSRLVAAICRNFRDLSLETAVWCPKKIHSTNVGGLDADSYVGYSRIEGKWGLNIRTIERDHESGAFVNQRVYALELCGNVEIVIYALKEVRDIWKQVAMTVDAEIDMLAKPNGELQELGKPGFTI